MLEPAFPRYGHLLILGSFWFCPTFWKDPGSQALYFLPWETTDLYVALAVFQGIMNPLK